MAAQAYASERDMTTRSTCWCGASPLETFSPEFGKCPQCGTLVRTAAPPEEPAPAGPPDWERAGRESLAGPAENALRALLQYVHPPASVLQIGCGHGALVALLRWAGYDAFGQELDGEAARFAHRTFHIPVLEGTLDHLALPKNRFNAIVLIHVLRRCEDPLGLLKLAAPLLQTGGVVLLETVDAGAVPESAGVPDENTLLGAELRDGRNRFLFSQEGVCELLKAAGLTHIRFEPRSGPLDYTQISASAQPLPEARKAAAEAALLAAPGGHLALALLDLDQRHRQVRQQLQTQELESLLTAHSPVPEITPDGKNGQASELLRLQQELQRATELITDLNIQLVEEQQKSVWKKMLGR